MRKIYGLLFLLLLGCNVETTRHLSALSADAAFISEWEVSSYGRRITLPLVAGYQYDFKVDWGDGHTDHITSHRDANISHTYKERGNYRIVITGKLEAINMNKRLPHKEVYRKCSATRRCWLEESSCCV